MLKSNIFFTCLISLFLCNSALAQAVLKFDIIGIDEEPKQNVLLQLETLKGQGALTPKGIINIFHQGASEIKIALQPYGFFKAKVSSQLLRNNQEWLARYVIFPQEPLRITYLAISLSGPGRNNPTINSFLRSPPLQVGDVFNVPVYHRFKRQWFTIVKNQGYLRAFFKNHILIDLAAYTCKMTIQLVTGPQFYLGPFIFKNHPYSERFLRRFICVKPGEVFSSERLLELQRRMEKSYFFKRVVFKPNFRAMKARKIPVEVHLTPPKPVHYTFGLGYGTLTGPRISAGMSLRHIGQEGHHLEAELKLSKIISGAAVTYYIPGCDPLTEEWLMGVNYKSFHPKAGRSNSVTLLGGYSYEFDRAETIFTLNYLTDSFALKRQPPAKLSHEFYPSAKLSYVRADDIINPHNGHSLNLTLQAAAKDLLSSTSFASFQTRIKWIVSPLDFSRVILRGDLGMIGVSNLPYYPMALRYFAGGMNSIRGFADSSIGPGKYLLIGSAEYQNRIKGNFFGAIFYDAGIAANTLAKRKSRGVGIGGVYYTAVGPIKLYVAQAVSKHTRPKSVEFSVGPEFS